MDIVGWFGLGLVIGFLIASCVILLAARSVCAEVVRDLVMDGAVRIPPGCMEDR